MTNATETDTETSSAPDDDFRAAMNEIQSNLEVRRLMLVVSHILVPALAMAMSDCLTGSSYPVELSWLPKHILLIVGTVLAVSGTIVTWILARCHFGLVVNGSKLRIVTTGDQATSGLNWLGVTTNFTMLTGLSAGGGAALVGAAIGFPWAGVGIGFGLGVLLLAGLDWNHRRANALVAKLAPHWVPGEVSTEAREEHARLSLEGTTADISIVVTMAVALFAGTFNSMTNIGGIPSSLQLDLGIEAIRRWGVTVLGVFTLLSILLSCRMVVRLRIALAEHSHSLAQLRSEPEDAFRFRIGERTYLLYFLLIALGTVVALIAAWSAMGTMAATIAASIVGLGAALWYPIRLGQARRAAQAKRAA